MRSILQKQKKQSKIKKQDVHKLYEKKNSANTNTDRRNVVSKRIDCFFKIVDVFNEIDK